MKLKKRLILAAIVLTVTLAFAGCGASSGESTLERAQNEGSVTIGFANEKPYAYETADGKLTGEAVEVARAVLNNLGIEELNGELTEFGSLIPGLNAKRFDMITAGMFITPDRAQEVSFANPEYRVGEAIAVTAGNPLNIKSYEDIAAHDSARVAVPGGAIEYEYLIKVGVPEDRIITVPDMPSALSALQAGRAEVITATGPSLQATLDTANDDDIERVVDFTQPVIDGESVVGYGATAFRKEDQDFVDAFNAELNKLQESGELLEIIEPFGFTEAELPGDVTVEDLVQ
ncbi:ectoine/hydroxyectoine ABC transporter substrate-binding protein EhuB [Alkalibacter rhizosphaerae]|uniref:Ectoine/hydroxyectoine ABC transporter substrate-binding protein EhuB n=1 Tax=Alkalibacter rhizosphaerae TaxID=2815577 RepID=A0A975AJG9_9FIRM|nr:ectoine/hydroxyectoine ABC transporter substrate-binding protein EhuB [Alkalibacter rhizosphaerae]QSX09729.1 ectoine/hydroxyectoine ABC transporter substrate-binding protein EhuB [Alkalibacter rhizosphaerae]